ncbi:MAG: Txe/YoeB family addiction module toxin [Rickettsiales bacterium]|nr:MAG: Txe/YoeB family addiction module toxin [Rickettsiales bacterium]
MYKIYLTTDAQKDARKIAKSKYKQKIIDLLSIIEIDPYKIPYERLRGLDSVYSRRINLQHRLVYAINEYSDILAKRRL